jgi:hypothetical protein
MCEQDSIERNLASVRLAAAREMSDKFYQLESNLYPYPCIWVDFYEASTRSAFAGSLESLESGSIMKKVSFDGVDRQLGDIVSRCALSICSIQNAYRNRFSRKRV